MSASDRTSHTRKCLKCGSRFESEGPHNRLCDGCNNLNKGRQDKVYSLTTANGKKYHVPRYLTDSARKDHDEVSDTTGTERATGGD